MLDENVNLREKVHFCIDIFYEGTATYARFFFNEVFPFFFFLAKCSIRNVSIRDIDYLGGRKDIYSSHNSPKTNINLRISVIY